MSLRCCGEADESDGAEHAHWCQNFDATGLLVEVRLLRQQLDNAIAVLRSLIELKDGPHDEAYEQLRPIVWASARRLTQSATPPCCDMHNEHCEPPSELCCLRCTEAQHPEHADGRKCVLT